jgi:hypothetical protein
MEELRELIMSQSVRITELEAQLGQNRFATATNRLQQTVTEKR